MPVIPWTEGPGDLAVLASDGQLDVTRRGIEAQERRPGPDDPTATATATAW
jgi:hypothetical protein